MFLFIFCFHIPSIKWLLLKIDTSFHMVIFKVQIFDGIFSQISFTIDFRHIFIFAFMNDSF